MLAAYAERVDPDNPLSALVIGDRPDPVAPDGWVTVDVRAASLNRHDVWALRGVGLGSEQVPMILGCDAAGVDPDGNEVIVHSVIGDPDWRADETLDPRRNLLSGHHQGTFAEKVTVPRRNLVPKPASLSFEEASCLPTAWLTAYRMLFTRAQVSPGDTVLVQGVGGGVASAAIALAANAGLRVWATSRSEEKRAKALELGADAAFDSNARLPERVDVVIETVGEATWGHSLRAVKRGGSVVVCGATTGAAPSADLNRVFIQQINILGSTMGTRDDLERLATFLDQSSVRPVIDRVLPLGSAHDAFAAMEAGELFGKVVLTI